MLDEEVFARYMKQPCTPASVIRVGTWMQDSVAAIAKVKNITPEVVVDKVSEVCLEDGVSNEFVAGVLSMWEQGLKDNVNFTAREAMLYQHVYWTNVAPREYTTNSIRVQL